MNKTESDATVTIPHNVRLAEAAASEESRYSITGIRVRPTSETGYAYADATTGRIAARCRVDCTGDLPADGVVIPRNVIEAGAKGWTQKAKAQRAAKGQDGFLLGLNGLATATDGRGATLSAEYQENRFPDIDAVLEPKDEPTHRITINPQYLVALAKAIGIGFGKGDLTAINLEFRFGADGEHHGPVIARNGDNVGAIMPMGRV